MHGILEFKYRLNPVFSLTSPDELDPDLRRKYDKLAKKKSDYYILHAPPEAKLSVKIINNELAHFLNQLKKPSYLNEVEGSFRQGSREDQEQFISGLLLNSVLEAEMVGEFISGVNAMNRILGVGPSFAGTADSSKTYIQLLSERALHFAYHSALKNPRDISFLLYDFNRLPLSRRWLNRFPDQKSVTGFFDLDQNDTWPGMPPEIKTSSSGQEGSHRERFHRFWRYWRRRDRKRPRSELSYKVYLSFKPLELAGIFREVREIAFDAGAYAIKLPRVLTGLLRPDKLIVYFTDYLSASEFAGRMILQTVDNTPHGTPFTFQLDPENSGITLGVDPPRERSERLSWRLYLTAKLALAIQGARRDHTGDYLDYIYTHMRTIGVDSKNWRPASDHWDIDFHLEGLENTAESPPPKR